MRPGIFWVLALAVFAAGCVSQQAAEPDSSAGCADTGCPVDLSQLDDNGSASPTVTTLGDIKCGDGILEAPEECEKGIPCKSGYCQKCTCVEQLPNETVTDCAAACLSEGYKNNTIVDDGSCTFNYGADNPTSVRCAYRKVFPMAEPGKVCCCRDLKYIRCDFAGGGFKCPEGDAATKICRDNKPNANATSM